MVEYIGAVGVRVSDVGVSGRTWARVKNVKTRRDVRTGESRDTGIFSQKQPDGEWHLIVYYLKTMIDAELNYPIYNKEMLAIVFSF